MLRMSLAFLVLALVAALFGYSGVAATSADIANTLFFMFLVLFLLTLVFGVSYRRAETPPVI